MSVLNNEFLMEPNPRSSGSLLVTKPSFSLFGWGFSPSHYVGSKKLVNAKMVIWKAKEFWFSSLTCVGKFFFEERRSFSKSGFCQQNRRLPWKQHNKLCRDNWREHTIIRQKNTHFTTKRNFSVSLLRLSPTKLSPALETIQCSMYH